MKRVLSAIFLMMALCVLFGATSAYAASKQNGYIELSFDGDDSYKADLTGDGKKEDITLVNSGTAKRVLSVNEKAVKSWNPSKAIVTIRILPIGKESFVEISQEDMKTRKVLCGIYKLQSGKLKCVMNYQTLVNKKILTGSAFVSNGNAFDMVYVTKVKGKTVQLQASLGTKSLGQVKIENLKMLYKGGKFTLQKTAGKASFRIMDIKNGKQKDFEAAKKIPVYKAAGSKKKAGFTITRNTKFKVTNGAIIKKNVYFKVKTSKGKTGWILLNKTKLVRTPGMLIWG